MQTINLNQNSFRLFPTIYMVQNDTGRELKMILDDVTLAGTETGAVAIKRSDGSYYTISATIDTTNNAFDADMTQALTQPSRTECQLKVTASDDAIISTYTFIIMVQPSTDGISEEQLGYSVQQLRQDAEDIRTGGMPADLRLAILQLAQKVAYIDNNGAQYYQDLYDALIPTGPIPSSITAVYTQGGTVYDADSLDSLKDGLVVTAHYSDSSSETIASSDYTLSGSLTSGTSTITVSYENLTTTFTVTVTATLYSLFNHTFANANPINTNIKLLESDRDLSIVVDADFAGQRSGSSQIWRLFNMMNSTSPWAGINLQGQNGGNICQLTLITNSSTTIPTLTYNYIGNVKLVLTHSQGGSWNYYYKIGSASVVSGTVSVSFSSITANLIIGGTASASSVFNGTVNSFVAYGDVISSDRINDFMGA